MHTLLSPIWREKKALSEKCEQLSQLRAKIIIQRLAISLNSTQNCLKNVYPDFMEQKKKDFMYESQRILRVWYGQVKELAKDRKAI